MRRPLLAAVVLPLVVIVGFQSAWAAYACRVDRKVRDHCCCKTEKRDHAQREAPDVPRITARGCCDVTIHEQPKTPDAREAARPVLAHLDVVVPVLTVAPIVARVEHVAPSVTGARAPPRVPLFLDKHALLR